MTSLRMNGGDGETSYAKNSYIASKVLSITKSIKEEAIHKMYMSTGRNANNVAIADLGCSSGSDGVWSVIYDLIKSVHEIHQQQQEQTKSAPTYSIYLNDLPGNDFNTIFKSVPKFQERLKEQMQESGPCFIHGVPGSFFNQLFENQTLHFVHSSYSIHWLSRVSRGIETDNKGSIYISKTSPTNVLNAYYSQFRSDFLTFLSSRAKEMVDNGWMVLTLVGRRSEERSSKECCYIWELLSIALNRMVSEGLLEKEKVDSFNIPIYYPSPKEIRDGVKEQGSFTIDHLDVSEVNWDPKSSFATMSHNDQNRRGNQGDNNINGNDKDNDDHYFNKGTTPQSKSEKQIDIVRFMRSVVEPILADHFGEAVMEEIFMRYNHIVADRMKKERGFFVNITISLYKNSGMSKLSNRT